MKAFIAMNNNTKKEQKTKVTLQIDNYSI